MEFVDNLPPARVKKVKQQVADHQLVEVQKLARELMDTWGLKHWVFKFDGGKRRYGCCHYGTLTISLSRHLVKLNSLEDTRDTILHEIAHALAGPSANHGPKWREQCIKVGAKPKTCHTSQVAEPNYKLYCYHCDKYLGGRYRKTRTAILSICCHASVKWVTN